MIAFQVRKPQNSKIFRLLITVTLWRTIRLCTFVRWSVTIAERSEQMKLVHKRPLNVVKIQLPYSLKAWKKLPAHAQATEFAEAANPVFDRFKLDSLRIAKFNLRDPSVTFSQRMGDTLCMYFVVGEFLPDVMQDEQFDDEASEEEATS